jgi:DNA-binding transcriptional MerR regulator
MSAEAIRQIVREEVARMKPSEDGSRKLMQTFQAQIADLKDRIAEYEKSNNQKLQECSMVLNENIRVEA